MQKTNTFRTCLILLSANVLRLACSNAITSFHYGLPNPWYYLVNTNYWGYEADGFSAITSIEFSQDTTGSFLYGICTNGRYSGSDNGHNLTLVPNFSASTYLTTVTLTATQTVREVQAVSYLSGGSYFLVQMSFILSDGTTQTVSGTNFNSYPLISLQKYQWVIPAESRFIGFTSSVLSYGALYNLGWLAVFWGPCSCNQQAAATLELSTQTGASQNILTGVVGHVTFAPTLTTSGTCALYYSLCSPKQSFKITVTPPAGGTASLIVLNTPNVPTIAFATSSQVSDVGIYSILVEVVVDQTIASATMTYQYQLPCSTTLPVPTAFSILSASVLSTAQTSVAMWNDAASVSGGATNACGAINFSFQVSASPNGYTPSMSTIFQMTSASTTVSIAASPTLAVQIGTYTIITKGCLVNYPSQCASTTSQVSITACVVSSVAVSQTSNNGALASQEWTPLTPASTFSYSLAVVQTPACGYTPLTWAVTTTSLTNTVAQASLFQTISSTGVFTAPILTLDSQKGVYTITVSPFTLNGVAVSTFTGLNSFTLTVVDPCLFATLSWSASLSNFSFSVSQLNVDGSNQNVTQQAPSVVDSISTAYLISNFCGAFTFAVFSAPLGGVAALNSAEISIGSASGLITVWTSNAAAVGQHTVNVTATLNSGIFSFLTTTLSIKPCFVTSFSINALSTTNDQSYYIGNATLNWNLTLSTVQVPACGYAESFTASNYPSFVTVAPGSPILFWAYSRYTSDAQTATISVTSTLTSYTYNTTSCSSTFVLNVIDPCLTTQIEMVGTSALPNLTLFAGQNQSSSQIYTFQDSMSLKYTLPTDGIDFCGGKNFWFQSNSTNTTYFVGQNAGSITLSVPQNATDFGLATSQLVVYMSNYQKIQSTPYLFTSTILGSEPPATIGQFYKVFSPMISIPIGQFEILPNGYENATLLNFTLEAYVFTSTQAYNFSSLNLTFSSLSLLSNYPWIEFNQSSSIFTVFSQDNSISGFHTIFIVQNFTSFPGFHPFAQFVIQIQEYLPIPGAKPYFDPGLTNKFVQQCSDQNNTLWVYSLPPVLDQLNSTVSIGVIANNQYFNFNDQTNIISQVKFFQEPTKMTIKVLLTNIIGATGSYHMIVEFGCKQNQTQNTSNNNLNFAMLSKQQKKWPTAKILQIDTDGLMHISFNQKMNLPQNPGQIQNSTVLVNGVLCPILKIEVQTGHSSEPKMLKFNWTFVSFSPQEMQIQLNFENILYVSSNSRQPELISIQVYGIQLFADQLGNYMYPEYKLAPKVLPRLASKSAMEAMKSLGSTVQGAMTTVMVTSMAATFLIAGPLNQILSAIKQLQISTHLLLINLSYPATLSTFYGMLMQVLTFQFYDLSPFFSETLKLDDAGQTPYTTQFGLLGYNALYIVQNFGTQCGAIFIVPVFWTSLNLVIYLSGGLLKKYQVTVSQQMFWNSWVALYNEAYLFLGVCVAINIKAYLFFNTAGNAFNSLVSCSFGCILLLFPLFVCVFYNWSSVYFRILAQDQNIMSRYGVILEGLNIKRRGRVVLLFPVLTLLRKLTLVYVLIYRQAHVTFNIFFLTFQALFMMLIVGIVEPYSELISNKMEFFNEAFILISTYHFYEFTDFMPDVEAQEMVGQSLVVITCMNIVVNLSVAVMPIISSVIRKTKFIYLDWKKFKQTKRQQERQRLMIKVKLRQARFKAMQLEAIEEQKKSAEKSKQAQLNSADLLRLEMQQIKIKKSVVEPTPTQIKKPIRASKPTLNAPSIQKQVPPKPIEKTKELVTSHNFIKAKVKPKFALFNLHKPPIKTVLEQPELKQIVGRSPFESQAQKKQDHRQMQQSRTKAGQCLRLYEHREEGVVVAIKILLDQFTVCSEPMRPTQTKKEQQLIYEKARDLFSDLQQLADVRGQNFQTYNARSNAASREHLSHKTIDQLRSVFGLLQPGVGKQRQLKKQLELQQDLERFQHQKAVELAMKRKIETKPMEGPAFRNLNLNKYRLQFNKFDQSEFKAQSEYMDLEQNSQIRRINGESGTDMELMNREIHRRNVDLQNRANLLLMEAEAVLDAQQAKRIKMEASEDYQIDIRQDQRQKLDQVIQKMILKEKTPQFSFRDQSSRERANQGRNQ